MENKENKCPKCSCKLNDHTCVSQDDMMPSPGDIGICLECKTILVYDENLFQREPTLDEIETFKEDAEFWNEIQKAIYIAKEIK